MFLIMAILILVTALTAKKFIKSYDGEGWAVLTAITGLLAIVLFFFMVKWQPSSDTLTGYVYQRNNAYGYASYSLRFSQNAGMDEQPSFCVQANSDQDRKLREVVGKDIKVQVSIPSKGFRLVNNPWECSSFATLDKIVE